LQHAGVRVRRAAGSSLGNQTYGVLVAFMRDAIGFAEDDPPDVIQRKLVARLETLGATAEDIDQMVPVIAHLVGAASPNDRLRFVEPEQLKRQLFLAVRNLTQLDVNGGPLILLVEDLHRPDAAPAEGLRSLAEQLSE